MLCPPQRISLKSGPRITSCAIPKEHAHISRRLRQLVELSRFRHFGAGVSSHELTMSEATITATRRWSGLRQ